MNQSDYRREYAAYCSASERERYRHHSGIDSSLRLEEIEDRYADLWTPAALDDLQRALEETPAHLETERAGLRALVNAARLEYSKKRALEVTAELARCEDSARVEWEGARFTAADVPERIAHETDGARRRELVARWQDALRACDDLRAVRFESLKESARALGFGGCAALYEEIAGVDVEKLAASADAFLERTGDVYRMNLARWTARHLSPFAAPAPDYADALFFRRLVHLEPYFAAHELLKTYNASMESFGIRAGTQKNVRLDDVVRPLKKSRSACFAVNPPEEVWLVVGAERSGADLYATFFHEAGCAQLFGWSSRETATRYPEFVHAPDDATREGHAFLFSDLFHDAAWIGEHFHVRPSESNEIARSFALRELHDVRRCCAALRHTLVADRATDVRSEIVGESYAALLGEATGFRHHPSISLFDAGDGFRAATALRARLFAAGWRERLRERHGHRWWASRAASDELIDVWNTGGRYRVEELARLIGVGELDFDLLASTLTTAINVR